MANQVYRYELEGFFGTVASTAELQARVGALKAARPDLIGKTCKVYRAEGSLDCWTIRGAPALITVGA